jgi:hypothetical protein
MALVSLAGIIDVVLFLEFFIPLKSAGRNVAALLVALFAGGVFVLMFIVLVKEWKQISGR